VRILDPKATRDRRLYQQGGGQQGGASLMPVATSTSGSTPGQDSMLLGSAVAVNASIDSVYGGTADDAFEEDGSGMMMSGFNGKGAGPGGQKQGVRGNGGGGSGGSTGRVVRGSTRPLVEDANMREKMVTMVAALDDNNREIELQRMEIRRLREQVHTMVGQVNQDAAHLAPLAGPPKMLSESAPGPSTASAPSLGVA
jgi:hypothetical protein